MIYISQIRINIDKNQNEAIEHAIKKLGIKKNDVNTANISKISIDARHGSPCLVCSVTVSANLDEEKLVHSLNDGNIKFQKESSLTIPDKSDKSKLRPIVIGFGPAGMFCALILAKAGLRPIILERGSSVDVRVEDVQKFWNDGILNPFSNVQFGEGGAGTFSDGKLVTRIGSPLCRFVLSEFVKHGAPENILYMSKPHVGTDLLVNVVKSIRNQIVDLGGEIHFNTVATDFSITNGKITAVKTNTETEFISDNVVLAIGHSARDTFEQIVAKQIHVIPKAFSVGVRIEHLQKNINRGLYGKYAEHPALPNGEYQLSHKLADGRTAYTFCMCPGGQVVPSSSEDNTVVVNGMSRHARDGKNANCGFVVSVSPDDFGNGVLDGVKFQRNLEQIAFKAGGENYKAPAQTVGNFLMGKSGLNLNSVKPSYSIGVTPADFEKLLPRYVVSTMKNGLEAFDRKIKGFSAADAVLTGIETRTSSPIRILRDENMCAENVSGLYPCGEGAGYAGGIMSAAVDGIKVAMKIIDKI